MRRAGGVPGGCCRCGGVVVQGDWVVGGMLVGMWERVGNRSVVCCWVWAWVLV